MKRITALAGAALALFLLAACSGVKGAAPAKIPVPEPSVAVTIGLTQLNQIICSENASGMTPAEIFNSLYEAPENQAQVHRIVTAGLSRCAGAR